MRCIREEQDEGERGERTSGQNERTLKIRLVCIAIAGALAREVLTFTNSGELPRLEPADHAFSSRSVINLLFQVLQLFGNFWVILSVFAAFTVIAVIRYRKPGVWTFAFLAGYLLAFILRRWL